MTLYQGSHNLFLGLLISVIISDYNTYKDGNLGTFDSISVTMMLKIILTMINRKWF